MKNVNVLSDDQKLNVALAFARNPDLKVSEAAVQFNIGETSARRYRDTFAEKAIAVLKAEKEAAEAAEASTAIAGRSVENPNMGFRERNGRMSFIRAAVAELGTSAKAAVVYARANELAAKDGVAALNKSAFYALKSEVIRDIRAANPVIAK